MNISGYKNILILPNKLSRRQEFFLLAEHDNISDELILSLIGNVADQWFELITGSEMTDESFKKNCTLILCCNSANISSENVLAVEEDSYNFKKNVIVFTHSELKSWTENIKSTLTVEQLNLYVNQAKGGRFTQFKVNDKNGDDYYSLLMKIVTKIPIMNYIPAEKELYDLVAKIKNDMPEKNKKLFDFMLSLDLASEDEVVENILSSEWELRNE